MVVTRKGEHGIIPCQKTKRTLTSTSSRRIVMNTQLDNNIFSGTCTVTPIEGEGEGYHVRSVIEFDIRFKPGENKVDTITNAVEENGNKMKRMTSQEVFEKDDETNVKIFQEANPTLKRYGKQSFTFITQFGHVSIQRQSLYNIITRKKIIPSKIVWRTSQNRHITERLREIVCEKLQHLSFRQTAQTLSEQSGEKSLIVPSTVRKILQSKRKELHEQQLQFVQDVKEDKKEIDTTNIKQPKRTHEAKEMIHLEMDEIVTKSQLKGQRWNTTYTATLTMPTEQNIYLIAPNEKELTELVNAHLIKNDAFAGNMRLEVLSDGASWIGDYVASLKNIEKEHILCWYHLEKKMYEGLSSIGLTTKMKNELQHELLGALWRGNLCQVVLKLWSYRTTAKTLKRLEELIGYLLKRKRCIKNYEQRKANHQRTASNQVEKWNDHSIANRCKNHGMSWVPDGVFAIGIYAAQKRLPQDNLSHSTYST